MNENECINENDLALKKELNVTYPEGSISGR